MKITIGTTLVCDGVRLHAYDLRVAHSRSLQVQGFLRALRSTVFDRGNMSQRVSFRVDRTFDSVSAAWQWILTHYALFQGTQDVKFEIDNGAGGSLVIDCLASGVGSSDAEWKGLCVPVSYELEIVAVDVTAGGALEWEGAEMRLRYDLDGLTGGTSTKLDAITTVSKTPGQTAIWTYIGGVIQLWILITDPDPGVTAEDAPGGIVKPDDYHASTNPKIWVLKK
jgi:hypothetical protein